MTTFPPHTSCTNNRNRTCRVKKDHGPCINSISCKKYGKIAGFWNSDVTGKAEMGFRFLVVDGDIHSMQAALTKSLKEKRELMEKAGVL